jgi:hypothetical protein
MITELGDNGPSNLRKAAEDALESLKEFEKLIMDSLQNGASAEVAEHFNELQDMCLPQPGTNYDDSPLTDFIAKFRGDEGDRRLENRGRGRPRKNQDTVSENHFPLRSGSWKKLNKDLETLQSRLGKASAFFNVGKKLDDACENWFLKSKPPHDKKSHSRFNREVRRLVEEQLSVISDLGIDVTKLASKDASDDSFETQLHTSIKEIEDQLRCGGSDLAAPKDSLPEFRTMDSLAWGEVTITIRNKRSCRELVVDENVEAASESKFCISARGKKVITTARDLQFVKATSETKAKKSLMTLLKFALFHGEIDWSQLKAEHRRKNKKKRHSDVDVEEPSGLDSDEDHDSENRSKSESDKRKVKAKDIQLLRNDLKRIFGILDSPISKYDKANGYELLCSILYEQNS